MTAPILFRWTGESFVPASQVWQRRADRAFVIGEVYPLVEHHERSRSSHNHYFASLSDAFTNLPEPASLEYATVEHFRKAGLIATGWHDEQRFAMADRAEAHRLAATLCDLDDYAVVAVAGSVVVKRTAKSQSMRAMGKKDFQQSKDDVLGWAWALCGLTPEEAAPHAGRAA